MKFSVTLSDLTSAELRELVDWAVSRGAVQVPDAVSATSSETVPPAEEAPSPDAVPGSGSGTALSSDDELPEEVRFATKLSEVTNHFVRSGAKTRTALLAACERHKSEIAILARVSDLPERVARVALVLGLED